MGRARAPKVTDEPEVRPSTGERRDALAMDKRPDSARDEASGMEASKRAHGLAAEFGHAISYPSPVRVVPKTWFAALSRSSSTSLP